MFSSLAVFTTHYGNKVAVSKMDIQRIINVLDPSHCEVIYHVLKDEEHVEKSLTVQGTLEQVLKAFDEPDNYFVVFTFPTGLKMALRCYQVSQVIDNSPTGNCEITFIGEVDGIHQQLKYEVLGTFDQIIQSLTEGK
jgi:hypothetical protein